MWAAVALRGELIASLLLETLRSTAQDVNNTLKRPPKYSRLPRPAAATQEMQQVDGEIKARGTWESLQRLHCRRTKLFDESV